MAEESHGSARARKLGRRYGVIVLAIVAVAFTISLTTQIITQCFGLNAGNKLPPEDCVRGIRTLESALDDANGKAGREREGEGVHRAWSNGLMPEWSQAPAIERTCAQTPEGTQAYASLARLRHAYEVALDQRVTDVKPLRETLEAQIAPR
jgi:hypothetical protein